MTLRKKDILRLLAELSDRPDLLNKRHLKKIYALLIAMGHYPLCPWCQDYIYDINDFSWDHIKPKSAGGGDSLDNLQPMHKHCNNASKCDCVYQVDYCYDIQSELGSAILDVRVAVCKEDGAHKKKGRYNNNKRRVKINNRQR